MSDDEPTLFNDSFERCRTNPRFLDRFYDLFLGSSPTVAAKFTQTDLSRQKMMLTISLYIFIDLAYRGELTYPYIDRIAQVHSRTGKDIPAELYTLWLESLIQAVRECDPRFDPPTEAAWRRVLGIGIAYMTARY